MNEQSVLELSRWAAHAYGRYDLVRVRRIVEAAARAAETQAERYAQCVVSETGFGVVADTAITHLLCSRALMMKYADQDYISPRFSGDARMELPRPVGVLMVLTGSRTPVADVYRAVLVALLTRNAVILKPDPQAAACTEAAVRLLAAAADEAGAPAGVIQFTDSAESSAEQVDLVLDARAGEPAGSAVPAFVDATADVDSAAEKLLSSVVFNNSLLECSESVVFVENSVNDSLMAALCAGAAATLSAPESDRVRSLPELIGRDAMAIAERAGISVAPDTRILLADVGLHDRALVDEPLIRQHSYPLLAVVRVPDVKTGIRLSAAFAGFGGARSGGLGGSAVIHSRNPQTILDFATAVRVRRIVVNDSSSPGGAGLAGAGFGVCCEPEQLITWTQVAVDSARQLSKFEADTKPTAPYRVPAYPFASNRKPFK